MGQMGFKIHALLVILDPCRFVTRTCNGCPEFEIDGKDIPDEAFMHFVYLGRFFTCMQVQILSLWYTGIIAELAERNPITIQNGSSNPSSRKNLDS